MNMGIISVESSNINKTNQVEKTNLGTAVTQVVNTIKGTAEETLNFDTLTETDDFNETMINAQIETTNTEVIDPTTLTEEDFQSIIGKLSQEDYDKFVDGIEKYYDEEVKILEGVLKTEDGNGLEDMYNDLNNYFAYMTSGYANSTYLSDMEKQLEEKYNVSNVNDLLTLKNETEQKVNEIKETIKMTKNLKETAKYDYLQYLDSYNGFYSREATEIEMADLDKCKHYSEGRIASESINGPTPRYNYKEYLELHPNTTPGEFVQMVKSINKDADISGISNTTDLLNLVEAAEYYPEMLKKYEYLYKEDPERAEQYIEDIKYQINNIKGQIEAKEFLDQLYAKDSDAALAFLANEFGVHAEGLADGIETFCMGLYHTGEAVFGVENRTMDVGEYKKMYILQALMTEKDKINCGILNKDGTPKDPNSIIDFTDEYAGAFLKNNYEISQGIGNMLPSVLLSMVNPAVGSVAMGVSAGGNAYHSSMVEGNSYIQSIIYAGITGSSEAISERLLGGLPGLSDVQVAGWKSLLNAMRKEANQEMFQGVFDSLVRNQLFGEKLPSTWEELKEYGLDIGKQGLYGALTAGYMQIPSATIGTINISQFNTYMKENNISIDEYKKAIEELRLSDEKLADINEEIAKGKYSKQLITKIEKNRIIAKYDCNDTTVSILNKLTSQKDIESIQSKIDSGINVNNAALIEAVKTNNISIETLVEAIKNDKFSIKELTEIIKNDQITVETGSEIFKELVGTKLASWSTSDEVSYNLLKNLVLSCDKAGIKISDLSKSIEVMESMEDYYDGARKIDLQVDAGMLKTYRTHGIIHIFDVLTQSINAYTAINGALEESNMDLDTVMLAAVMHDTGMNGGKQIHLDVVDGKLVINVKEVQSSGTSVRESHSFNSGVDIINEAAALSKAGYSDAQIAEAALLAFAHSKSNSGLNPLVDNPAGWSFAIQALQEATKDSDFKIVDELIKAGIITNRGATTLSNSDITVKCPKVYEDNNGVIQLNDEGKPIKIDNAGGKKTGKIETYTFGYGVIDRLSHEALVVRIGDALTNNDNAGVNQFYGDITFKSTDYTKQSTPSDVLKAMEKTFEKEISKNEPKITSIPTEESLIRALLSIDDGLQDAGFKETQHSTDDSSVTFEVDGKVRNNSQPFVLGENNQTYEVKTNSNGGIDVVVNVKNSNNIPFCTLFAIQERAGELLSHSDGANELGINLVIKIDSKTQPEIADLYNQYEEYYKNNEIMKVKIEYKD